MGIDDDDDDDEEGLDLRERERERDFAFIGKHIRGTRRQEQMQTLLCSESAALEPQ